MSHIEFYGRIAEAGVDEIQQNGRYAIQEEAQAKIPFDVEQKLDIKPYDNVLDIGCGMGLNLLHLASKAQTVTGCDHPSIMDRLQPNVSHMNNVTLKGGDFLALNFKEKYTKILIYSVFPALSSMDIAMEFIDKAITLLDDNGMVLIGDIANIDKKDRFLKSKKGKNFQIEWDRLRNESQETDQVSAYQDKDAKFAIMNDQSILDILSYIRQKGLDAYVLNQAQELPFGNTREDILIVGPEYEQA